MKKIFLFLVSIIVSVSVSAQEAYDAQYDVNKDGVVDVNDVSAVVSFICGSGKKTDPETVEATMIPTDKPTWKNVGTIYFSSMCVYVLNNSLPKGLTIGTGDMMAAFIGDECRSAVEPTWTDGVWRYNMSIGGDADDPSPTTVVIRYYSAAKGAYCESEPITFKDGGILGSADSGYTIEWK